MSLLKRVFNIIFKPAAEWRTIASEAATRASLCKAYVIPLSALSLLAVFVAESLIGLRVLPMSSVRAPLGAGAFLVLLGLVLSLLGTWLLSLLINNVAFRCGGEKNSIQAFKLAAYASTPLWIIAAFDIIPVSMGFSICAGLYSIYLLYLGLPLLMNVARDNVLRCTLALSLCAAVVMAGQGLLSAVAAGIVSPSFATGRSLVLRDVALRDQIISGVYMMILKQSTKAMEEALANTAPVEPAPPIEMLDSVALAQLLPETLAGFPRLTISNEKAIDASLPSSSASADYGDGQAMLSLTLTDYTELNSLTGFWIGKEGESIYNGYFEKTGKIDGRDTFQRWERDGMAGKYRIAVADRLVVEVYYSHFPQARVTSLVSPALLGELESMAAREIKP